MKAVILSAVVLLSLTRMEAQSVHDPKGQNQDQATEIEHVKQELSDTQAQLAEAMRQVQELRREVQDLNAIVRPTVSVVPAPTPTPTTEAPTATAADQDPAILAAKVAELHQDKVESESKHSVKINGLILFNSYGGNRNFDVADVPNWVLPTSGVGGSVGATLRQTILGIDAVGPHIFGADTSADASIDFAGGSPTTSYGITTGILRLRTANVHLDWGKTRLNIGQDTPFFSPLSPTSYATVAEPALSWSGNLWVWTPEVMVEHEIATGENSSLLLQGGLLDPLTEEIPQFQGRQPTSGELSRRPAFAGRIALDRSHASALPFVVGFGGYRSEQNYDGIQHIQSWTLNSDLLLPMGKLFQVSGEWYSGQAAGGLGGGIASSVIFPNSYPGSTAIHALRSTGGWGQLKFTPNLRFEINGATGQDENFGHSLRFFNDPVVYYGVALKKNRTEFGNIIYKPNSFLLFALEYRHILTQPAVGNSRSGDFVSIAAGVKF